MKVIYNIYKSIDNFFIKNSPYSHIANNSIHIYLFFYKLLLFLIVHAILTIQTLFNNSLITDH